MPFVESEIVSQPECWRWAVELAEQGGLGLPEEGERVAVVGCGTSLYMAEAYAARREAAGHGWTDAFAASAFPDRRYDAVLVISRSGTTTEILHVLDRLKRQGNGQSPRTIGLTTDRESAASRQVNHPVALPVAAERSIVQTRFATTALALLRASLGEDLAAAIADAEFAVDAPFSAAPGMHRQLTFLGQGWSTGLANEAALKCREAAGTWTESYSAMEYRHGPISALHGDSLAWSLGDVPPGLDREIEALEGTLLRSDLDPMAELIRVQRFAVDLALLVGRDPDRPRGLSFSVVLEPGARGS